MVHRIIVIFFILANLILQINTVYACELTGGLAKSSCCCSHDLRHGDCTMADHCPASAVAPQESCCTKTVTLDTTFVSEVCGPGDLQKTWIVPATPSLTLIVNKTDTELVPAAIQRPFAAAETFSIYPGLPLYLATRRLRI